ncbi:hypothetical protein B0H13DRAFT_2648826 [Mycena leptocephala]|nr:hypothetical protein B0H13DRAFT_2648826 [Mycena leptocephala]
MARYSYLNITEPEDAPMQRPFSNPWATRPITSPASRPKSSLLYQGIGFWTPLWIIGGTVVAAAVAVAHHIVDTKFNDRPVDSLGFWTQNRTKSLEIVLAAAFKILFCFSAGVSLCQIAWHSMRRKAFSLADIDCPATLAITIFILASPLFTVFAPSLTVRQASPSNQIITVPTLDLASDEWLDDMILDGGGEAYLGPSGTWDKVVLQGLTSSGPVGWTIPDGCSPECRYNLLTTPPQSDPPAAYLMYYDADPKSGLLTGEPEFVWTVAYFPFAASNMEDGAVINAAGSRCTFYNATYEAQTHFVNGTQERSVSVVEFHEALNTTMRTPNNSHVFDAEETGRFVPGLGAPLHFFAFADAITSRLLGAIIRFTDGPIVPFGPGTGTLLLETDLFESPGLFNLSTPRFPGVNVSSSVTNMSQALENLVANISLSFVRRPRASPPSSLRFLYAYSVSLQQRHPREDILSAMGCLILVSILGMFSLIANGQPSSHSFSQLLLATRNPALDDIADTVEADSRVPVQYAADARLMFGEVDIPGRGIKAAFGLVTHQEVQMLRRRTMSYSDQ